MGRQILLTVIHWLILGQTFSENKVFSFAMNNIKSANSAPQLYRNVPLAVYASAAPYGAYSFQLPAFVAAPKTAASQVGPVKENVLNQLTDSYGNRFVGTPQLSSYKFSFPQQYIPLQGKLPEHLAQPLAAASANFQFKQSNGQFFGTPYRVPASLQGLAPTPLQFGEVYGSNVKYLAPNTAIYGNEPGNQQQVNTNAVSTNTKPTEQFSFYKLEPKSNQQKDEQLIVGKPQAQGIQVISHQPHGDNNFQRTQEVAYVSHDGAEKFQQIKDSPKLDHTATAYKQHNNQDKEKHEHSQESPHYESKYQIIETPHSPQIHRIQEHHPSNGEVKFQRIQEAPSSNHAQRTHEHTNEKSRSIQEENTVHLHKNKGNLQQAPAKQIITYINDINGRKTIVELETKPNLPLLDLTLLEPLTFDNPLVPQVQHFLPRISQATYRKLQDFKPSSKNYEKEFIMHKTISYDNTEDHEKPHQEATKKKQKKTTHKHTKNIETPKTTAVIYHSHQAQSKTNSPKYKETYDMKTHSEPVHYKHGSKSDKNPVKYSYSSTSQEPAQEKSVQYHGNDPSHLIYNFQPEEDEVYYEKSQDSAHLHDAENKKVSTESDENSAYHPEQLTHHPHSSEELQVPIHKEKKKHYNQDVEIPANHNTESEPLHYTSEEISFEPILKEYETNIRMLAPSAAIKVDPHRHVQLKSTPHPHPHSSPAPQEVQTFTLHAEQPVNSEFFDGPVAHVHAKSKHTIIQEETPDEMHMLREQMRQEMAGQQENSEENFEQGYHNAALGFPAYDEKESDEEKDIFNPDTYGVPRDHIEYDFDHTPLHQYQAERDEYPKEARSSYKDARDQLMQNYYTDYSASKPDGALDRYQNKLAYYKMFNEQKPDYLAEYEPEKKQKQKSSKYKASPLFEFHPMQDKSNSKSYNGESKPKKQFYEYDYSKEPRDNSAYASRPYQNYKSTTSFVEPQFQYGFEPVALPRLLDSELAAMASNDSSESEKPGMRKKIYKENWYIKKTRTSRAPNS